MPSTHRSSSRRPSRTPGSASTSPVPPAPRNPRELIRRLRSVDAETLLSFFTERQYISPRDSVTHLLTLADTKLGICPIASERAIAWLELNPDAPIGRLRRTELTQLARCLHRFLRHTSACAQPRSSAACPN